MTPPIFHHNRTSLTVFNLHQDGTRQRWTQVQHIRKGSSGRPFILQSITTTRFSSSARYLAVGDTAGLVTIYERVIVNNIASYAAVLSFHAFQSIVDNGNDVVEPDLLSDGVEAIRWIRETPTGSLIMILGTSMARIFKLHRQWQPPRRRLISSSSSSSSSQRRRLDDERRSSLVATFHCQYHDVVGVYNLNALALSSDQETFAMSDDFRINLWHFDHPDVAFNIVDMTPDAFDVNQDVIRCQDLHPHSCNLLAFSTSSGAVQLVDLRCQAHPRMPLLSFDYDRDANDLQDVSFCAFADNGRDLLARDSLSIKVWDLNMTSAPFQIFQLQDASRVRRAPEFDPEAARWHQFQMAPARSGSRTRVVTGTGYQQQGVVCDWESGEICQLHADVSSLSYARHRMPRYTAGKALVDWHPTENQVVFAFHDDLRLFGSKATPTSGYHHVGG